MFLTMTHAHLYNKSFCIFRRALSLLSSGVGAPGGVLYQESWRVDFCGIHTLYRRLLIMWFVLRISIMCCCMSAIIITGPSVLSVELSTSGMMSWVFVTTNSEGVLACFPNRNWVGIAHSEVPHSGGNCLCKTVCVIITSNGTGEKYWRNYNRHPRENTSLHEKFHEKIRNFLFSAISTEGFVWKNMFLCCFAQVVHKNVQVMPNLFQFSVLKARRQRIHENYIIFHLLPSTKRQQPTVLPCVL